MLDISANDMTMEKNPTKVQIYPQNRPESPPFIIPPVFARSTASQVPCIIEVNMIMVDCLNMRCAKVNRPSPEYHFNKTDLELLVFPHARHVLRVRIIRGTLFEGSMV